MEKLKRTICIKIGKLREKIAGYFIKKANRAKFEGIEVNNRTKYSRHKVSKEENKEIIKLIKSYRNYILFKTIKKRRGAGTTKQVNYNKKHVDKLHTKKFVITYSNCDKIDVLIHEIGHTYLCKYILSDYITLKCKDHVKYIISKNYCKGLGNVLLLLICFHVICTNEFLANCVGYIHLKKYIKSKKEFKYERELSLKTYTTHFKYIINITLANTFNIPSRQLNFKKKKKRD